MLSVSVIIPNFNNSEFLEKCVLSVLSQSYSGIKEIIIVDDCSTDGSKGLIKELEKKDKRIRHVFLEKNSGVSHSRNTGIKAAKSDYITCLDADDFYENDKKIFHEMSLIEKYKNLGKDVITYSIVCSCDHDGKEVRREKRQDGYYYKKNAYIKLLLDFNSKKVFRDYCCKKAILEECGLYNEDSSLFEDYELLLKLAKFHDVYCTYTFGTVYRDSLNGLSKKTPRVLTKTKNRIINSEINTNHFILRQILRFLRLSISIIKWPKKVFNNYRHFKRRV